MSIFMTRAGSDEFGAGLEIALIGPAPEEPWMERLARGFCVVLVP